MDNDIVFGTDSTGEGLTFVDKIWIGFDEIEEVTFIQFEATPNVEAAFVTFIDGSVSHGLY